MLGQPFEGKEDIEDIPVLADKMVRVYYEIPKDKRNGKCEITISTSFFVPKPFTPFQWAAMDGVTDFMEKQHIVKEKLKTVLNQKSIRYMWHDANVSELEGVFAREGTENFARLYFLHINPDACLMHGQNIMMIKNGFRHLLITAYQLIFIPEGNVRLMNFFRGILLMPGFKKIS